MLAILIVVPLGWIAAFYTAGLLCTYTPLSALVEWLFAAPAAESAIVYELADLYDLDFSEWNSYPGGDLEC